MKPDIKTKVQIKKFYLLLFIMAILSPIGIFIPEYFNSSEAWGEWAPNQVAEQVGYLPSKMADLSEIWKAPMADYSLSQGGPLEYIFSALVGLFLCGGIGFFMGKFFHKRN